MRNLLGPFLVWFVVVCLLLLLSLHLSARPAHENSTTSNGKPITLDVYPRVISAGMGKAEVRVQWLIKRHPDNRKWSFVLNSDEGDYQFSEGELNGESSPAIFPICTESNRRPCYRNVRAGFYVMEACVYRKERFCDSLTLEVH